MAAAPGPYSIKDIAQKVIQTNKDHQHALKVYTERLEAELQTVDRLLVCVFSSTLERCVILQMSADIADQEDEPELDVGGFVIVPGAKRAVSAIPVTELLSHVRDFSNDRPSLMIPRNHRSPAILKGGRAIWILHALGQVCSAFCSQLPVLSITLVKAKELEALAEAVRTENCRKQALDAQQRYGPV